MSDINLQNIPVATPIMEINSSIVYARPQTIIREETSYSNKYDTIGKRICFSMKVPVFYGLLVINVIPVFVIGTISLPFLGILYFTEYIITGNVVNSDLVANYIFTIGKDNPEYIAKKMDLMDMIK